MLYSSTATAPGTRPGLLGRVGRACHRHRWLTLIGWIAAVACLITLWTRFGAPADNNFAGSDPGQTLLNQHFHRQSGDTLTLAISSSGEITSPAVRHRVSGALAPFQHAAHVTSVSSIAAIRRSSESTTANTWPALGNGSFSSSYSRSRPEVEVFAPDRIAATS